MTVAQPGGMVSGKPSRPVREYAAAVATTITASVGFRRPASSRAALVGAHEPELISPLSALLDCQEAVANPTGGARATLDSVATRNGPLRARLGL